MKCLSVHGEGKFLRLMNAEGWLVELLEKVNLLK